MKANVKWFDKSYWLNLQEINHTSWVGTTDFLHFFFHSRIFFWKQNKKHHRKTHQTTKERHWCVHWILALFRQSDFRCCHIYGNHLSSHWELTRCTTNRQNSAVLHKRGKYKMNCFKTRETFRKCTLFLATKVLDSSCSNPSKTTLPYVLQVEKGVEVLWTWWGTKIFMPVLCVLHVFSFFFVWF